MAKKAKKAKKTKKTKKAKKTWKPWPEAKAVPLESTFVFYTTVRFKMRPIEEQSVMRFLNASHPEQASKEDAAFRRQEEGLPLFATEEEAEASRESTLVKAHYEFRRCTSAVVKVTVHRDGRMFIMRDQ